jgi:hypothetical protein
MHVFCSNVHVFQDANGGPKLRQFAVKHVWHNQANVRPGRDSAQTVANGGQLETTEECHA